MTEPEKKQALKAFFVLVAGMTVITLVYLILIYPYRFRISPASPLYMLKYLFVFIDLVFILLYFCFYFTKTNKFEELLNDEYRNALENTLGIIDVSYLTISQKNDIRRDLLDLLITAQESGKCVNDVIGDTSKFANDIIESYGRYLWIYIGLIDGFLFMTIFILLENFVLNFVGYFDSVKLFTHTIYIFDHLFFVYFFFFLIPYQRMTKKNKFLFILIYLVPILLLSLAFIIPSLEIFYQFLSLQKINLIPNIYVLLIYILIIPLAILLKKTIRNKTKIKLISGD